VDDDKEREEGFVCGRGRKRTEGAETPRAFVMSMVASCGNLDRERWGAQLNIGSRESLDDAHRPTAIGANPKIARTGGRGLLLGFGWRAEQGEAEWHGDGPLAIGQESEVPNADEAFGTQGQQETA
jgi:hypothetical protein